jgi:hypothetical protein
MIRVIDLGDQLGYDDRHFAIYDTVVDKFVDLQGEQTWELFSQFEYQALATGRSKEFVERVRGLMPPPWGTSATE